MTEHRPPACHYDRTLGERVTREHRDNCEDPSTHSGCAPCTAPHCLVCGRNHTNNDHPWTCPECIGKIRADLADLCTAYAALALEATDGGGDGHLVAAAPIPGGNAQVLIGPTVRLDVLRTARTMSRDHHPTDPLPALAVLAQWEDIYRAWLGHTPQRAGVTIARPGGGAGIRIPARASVSRAIGYLDGQLDYLANHLDGTEPDWLAFVHQLRRLRSDTERALHDERDSEEGVECFECGDRLVRRFRDAKRCGHATPARVALQAWVSRRNVAQDRLRVYATYPEVPIRFAETHAAQAPPARLLSEARKPCAECAASPGGIDNPEPGRSWECPGCRKEYDPGEYATAVRRSLIDEADGWCTLVAAADAARDVTGRAISAPTIRTWIERGDDIGVCCAWKPGTRAGVQLVFWPDVLDRANEVRSRGRRAKGAS